jgi:uncharacterized protein
LNAFVDTSAFFAALDRGDSHNSRSKELLSRGEALVTTEYVLVETWRLARARLGYAVAENFWGGLRDGTASVERILPVDLDTAWEIGERFADQSFSIVDRTSFAAMERLGVHRAIAFDDDFAVYRYGNRRDRAFEVLR